MLKLVFATANQNKVNEIQLLIPNQIQLLSLKDINCEEDIPETQLTIEGNALQKANYVYEKYKYNCFADDTGLEIEVLNFQPGVLSARYAGISKNADANMDKVLKELTNVNNRKARFKTVISLRINDQVKQFEGIVKGTILNQKIGANGFGYDPIFMPDGYNKSFAEMTITEKNIISHRALAVNKLVEYLNKL
ncbi:MAG: non-canonical purine NTP diphosphatase [Bacteroidia bacterium]